MLIFSSRYLQQSQIQTTTIPMSTAEENATSMKYEDILFQNHDRITDAQCVLIFKFLPAEFDEPSRRRCAESMQPESKCRMSAPVPAAIRAKRLVLIREVVLAVLHRSVHGGL